MGEETAEHADVAAEVTGDPQAPTIRLVGELDMAGVARIRACFDTVLAGSPERLDVDLADLAFIDSSGLSVLIEASKAVPLRVLNATPAVRRVFTVTGLDEVWQLEP